MPSLPALDGDTLPLPAPAPAALPAVTAVTLQPEAMPGAVELPVLRERPVTPWAAGPPPAAAPPVEMPLAVAGAVAITEHGAADFPAGFRLEEWVAPLAGAAVTGLPKIAGLSGAARLSIGPTVALQLPAAPAAGGAPESLPVGWTAREPAARSLGGTLTPVEFVAAPAPAAAPPVEMPLAVAGAVAITEHGAADFPAGFRLEEWVAPLVAEPVQARVAPLAGAGMTRPAFQFFPATPASQSGSFASRLTASLDFAPGPVWLPPAPPVLGNRALGWAPPASVRLPPAAPASAAEQAPPAHAGAATMGLPKIAGLPAAARLSAWPAVALQLPAARETMGAPRSLPVEWPVREPAARSLGGTLTLVEFVAAPAAAVAAPPLAGPAVLACPRPADGGAAVRWSGQAGFEPALECQRPALAAAGFLLPRPGIIAPPLAAMADDPLTTRSAAGYSSPLPMRYLALGTPVLRGGLALPWLSHLAPRLAGWDAGAAAVARSEPEWEPEVRVPGAALMPVAHCFVLPPRVPRWTVFVTVWKSVPALVRRSVLVITLIAVLGLLLENQSGDVVAEYLSRRAAIELSEDFRSGFGDWTGEREWAKTWSHDPAGYARIGQLALLGGSRKLSDYRLEFLGQITTRSLGWVCRAADFENYYAMKLSILKPGPLPEVALARYAVIAGQEERPVQTPIRKVMHNNTPYRVQVEVEGDGMTISIDGEVVDYWRDERLKSGGIGFFSDKDAQAQVYWVRLSHQVDFLGKLCAYLAPQKTQNRNGDLNR
ncbi:MAG: hypothetical protein AAB225_11965 [Acidobacteriota bacterium]